MSHLDGAQRAVVAQVGALVDAHGMAVISVEGDAPGESFAYTVGLSAHDHPELVMMGIPPEVTHRLLNALGARVLRGEDLVPGTHEGLLANGYRLWVVPVPGDRTGEFFALAQLWAQEPVRGLQVVVPDAAGRFPHEDGVDPAYARAQPVLDPDWNPH